MRRCFLYLAVSLTAFLFGTFSVFLRFEQKNEIAQTVEENKVILQNESDMFANPQAHINQVEFVCEDKILQSAWEVLKQDLFGNPEADAKTNCADFLSLQQTIDLNNDGMKEIIIKRKNICANGECDNIWILEKQKNGQLNIILDDMATSVEIKKTQTNGYLDFVTGFRSPLGDSYGFTFYKFDGEQYSMRSCWEEVYSITDRNGVLRKLKKPRKHYLHCC